MTRGRVFTCVLSVRQKVTNFLILPSSFLRRVLPLCPHRDRPRDRRLFCPSSVATRAPWEPAGAGAWPNLHLECQGPWNNHSWGTLRSPSQSVGWRGCGHSTGVALSSPPVWVDRGMPFTKFPREKQISLDPCLSSDRYAPLCFRIHHLTSLENFKQALKRSLLSNTIIVRVMYRKTGNLGISFHDGSHRSCVICGVFNIPSLLHTESLPYHWTPGFGLSWVV